MKTSFTNPASLKFKTQSAALSLYPPLVTLQSHTEHHSHTEVFHYRKRNLSWAILEIATEPFKSIKQLLKYKLHLNCSKVFIIIKALHNLRKFRHLQSVLYHLSCYYKCAKIKATVVEFTKHWSGMVAMLIEKCAFTNILKENISTHFHTDYRLIKTYFYLVFSRYNLKTLFHSAWLAN